MTAQPGPDRQAKIADFGQPGLYREDKTARQNNLSLFKDRMKAKHCTLTTNKKFQLFLTP
jgi:hypothetical protein